MLHVWDWSKGNTSRVLKDVEYWGTERAAISPDGRHLVRAGGDILELATGKRSQIDLGGADVKIDGRTFGRIGHMRFSPDGGRLAMLVTNLDKDIPGRILSDVVQVVEFPSGRKLCEFPAGEAYTLRIGFSNDGRQVAAADTGRQVMLRDVAGGEVRRARAGHDQPGHGRGHLARRQARRGGAARPGRPVRVGDRFGQAHRPPARRALQKLGGTTPSTACCDSLRMANTWPPRTGDGSSWWTRPRSQWPRR